MRMRLGCIVREVETSRPVLRGESFTARRVNSVRCESGGRSGRGEEVKGRARRGRDAPSSERASFCACV